MNPIDDLRDLIGAFEDVYAPTGAGAEINLRNPETDDSSDVVLRYVRKQKGVDAGLFVAIAGGLPIRLVEAAPAIMARAAYHLPELATVLDAVTSQIELAVAGGADVLSEWLTKRGVLDGS